MTFHQTLGAFDGIIVFFSVVLLAVSSYFAYEIYRHNRMGRTWLALSVGLGLIALRQITLLGIAGGSISPDYFGLNVITVALIQSGLVTDTGLAVTLDIVFLTLAVSAFIAVGLWEMWKQFRSFDVTDQDAREKAKQFQEED